jgi:integrase
VFRPREPLHNLKPHRISKAALDLAEELEGTGGATVVKALQALKIMLAFRGVAAPWPVPVAEIDPEPSEKRELTMEQILWLLQHTPPGSLEEAAIALKMRTGIREVEMAELNVEDFDAEAKVIEVVLRSKGRRRTLRRQFYPIADDMVEMLVPFTVDRGPEDPLLPIGGARMKESSLRRRLVAASEAANAELHALHAAGEITKEEYDRKLIDPPLRGLKPIRAEVLTVVEEETDEREATAWSGHRDPETLRRHYLKRRRTSAKLEEKRRIAEILRRLSPLPRRNMD